MENGAVVSTLTPDQAVARMVSALTAGGAKVHSATPMIVTGEVITRTPPSAAVAIVLLLVMILPGILYMIWGAKTIAEPFAITIATTDGGTVLTPSGRGRGERAALYAVEQAA